MVHSRSIATTSGLESVVMSKRSSASGPGRGDDPALVAAAERHWFVQSTAGGAGGGRAAGQGPGAGSTDYRGGDPGRAEQSASRHPCGSASVGVSSLDGDDTLDLAHFLAQRVDGRESSWRCGSVTVV